MDTKKLLVIPALALTIVGSGAVAGYATLASAATPDTPTTQTQKGFHMGMGGMGRHGPGGRGHHGVMGEVTAVSGTTLTVKAPDGSTFTVEAGAAKVQHVVDTALSEVHVGDRIGVHGDVSGTTVTAKEIMDDLPPPPAPATTK